MKVLIAEKAGACYGVQRALDIAKSTLGSEGSVSTLGPLIHNPKVIAELEGSGMKTADSVEDVATDTVIIRSHGVTPDIKRRLETRGLNIIDATCPHVLRAQIAAAELAREGYQVIVVGEEGHPEVEGLKAYATDEGARVHVVQDVGDLPDELPNKVGIVVQTTQTHDALNKITSYLEMRDIDYILKDTICSATKKRQSAAAQLADEVDAMVVIGGRNSSNTTRLAEICASKCPRTIHIESTSEIDDSFFDDVEVVGISAGASTPESQIVELLEYLQSL